MGYGFLKLELAASRNVAMGLVQLWSLWCQLARVGKTLLLLRVNSVYNLWSSRTWIPTPGPWPIQKQAAWAVHWCTHARTQLNLPEWQAGVCAHAGQLEQDELHTHVHQPTAHASQAEHACMCIAPACCSCGPVHLSPPSWAAKLQRLGTAALESWQLGSLKFSWCSYSISIIS